MSASGAVSIAYQSNGAVDLNKKMYLLNSRGDYFTGVKVEDGLKGFIREFYSKGAVFNGYVKNNMKNGHGNMIRRLDGQHGSEFSSMWYNSETHGPGVLK